MAEQITKMYRVTLEHDEGVSTLTFNEYDVVRQTDKCAWIKNRYKKQPQRVSIQEGGRQPFAFTTKKEALNAFIQRKKRHVRILRHELKLVTKAMQVADDMQNIGNLIDLDISHYDL